MITRNIATTHFFIHIRSYIYYYALIAIVFSLCHWSWLRHQSTCKIGTKYSVWELSTHKHVYIYIHTHQTIIGTILRHTHKENIYKNSESIIVWFVSMNITIKLCTRRVEVPKNNLLQVCKMCHISSWHAHMYTLLRWPLQAYDQLGTYIFAWLCLTINSINLKSQLNKMIQQLG